MKVAVIPNGHVTGRVVDAAGRPVAGLTIDLTPRAGLDRSSSNAPERLRTTTGRDGRYQFAGVPPGTFVVGVNTRQDPAEIPRVLHPGVIDLAGAAAVIVPPGGDVNLAHLTMPSSVEVAPLAGFVVDSHGSPVEGARVYLRGPNERDFIIGEPVTTDFMGRFALAASIAASYQIFAERPRPGDVRGRVDISNPVAFTATRSAPPLILRLKRP